jgi:hypothetical protein
MVKITDVKFGEIKIGRKIYYSDMIIWWDGKVEFRMKSHVFDISDFVKLLEHDPEIVVVGTGVNEDSCRIMEEVEELAERKGVRIYREITPKAAEMFNGFAADRKRVVAVMHTTC